MPLSKDSYLSGSLAPSGLTDIAGTLIDPTLVETRYPVGTTFDNIMANMGRYSYNNMANIPNWMSYMAQQFNNPYQQNQYAYGQYSNPTPTYGYTSNTIPYGTPTPQQYQLMQKQNIQPEATPSPLKNQYQKMASSK